MSLSLSNTKELLHNLLSADNKIRGNAENLFQELKKNPDMCLIALTQVIQSSFSTDIRSLAAVLLRRVLVKDKVSLWTHAATSTKEMVKLALMNCIVSEKEHSIRRKVCDTIGELASCLLEDGQWQDLLPAMFQWIESTNIYHRESAIVIFGMISEFIASSMSEHFSLLIRIFHECLIGSINTDKVKVSAIRAFGLLLMQINLSTVQEQFQCVLPSALQAMHSILIHQAWDEAQEGLEILIDILEAFPLFFNLYFKQYFEAMVLIAGETSFPDPPRQLALEFLVCMAEKSPSVCRKLPGNNVFISSTIPIIFIMMLEVEDDPEWNNCIKEDEDEITNNDVAMEALDRIVSSIGRKKSLPFVFSVIDEFLLNPSWKYRHAALMGMSQILEVIPNTKEKLTPIAQKIIHYLQDSHPRVRFASINALGQISTDHGPKFQNLFHAQVIPLVLHCMEDNQNPRVQSHVAAALINFIDVCDPNILELYLEQLLGRLFIMLRDGKRIVQEQAITAIASIADCAEELFIRFYDTFMPILKSALLLHRGDKENRLLRGKALECISLIGCAVGKEKFGADAIEVMNFLVKEQGTSMDSDDPQRGYILQAWSRICKCLGKDFFPYLPIVMPTLIEAATQQAEFYLDNFPDDDDEENEGMEVAQVNDRYVSIRTCVLEEKATACRIISCMIADLKEVFFPFVEQVTKILAPLITESFHDDIRSAAISAMPNLVLCVSYSTCDVEVVKQLLDFTLGRLVESLQSEPDIELVMTTIQAIKMCVENATKTREESNDSLRRPSALLNQLQLSQIVQALLVVLGESFQRRAIYRAERQVEEDLEEEEEDDETEAELNFIWTDCIGGLIRVHKEEFMPVFKSLLLDKILEMIQPYCLVNDRKHAVFIIDDIIEHTGTASHELFDKFIPCLLSALSSDHPSLIQAAAYGIGVAARVGGEAFRPYSMEAIHSLTQIVKRADVRNEENERASDNAVSALGLILEFHREVIDCASIYPQWLAYLPLKGDAEENVAVTTRLCNLIQRNDVYLMGTHGQNVPLLFRVLTDVLLLTNCDATLASLVLDQLKSIRSSLPQDVLQSVWTSLSQDQQGKLQRIIST